MKKRSLFSFPLFLVTIGIVYGDIGTSPMYVMKSIIAGNGGISQVNESFIVGALSLIIWTIALLTTVKYVLIAMKADNNGEGGIFSLYSLVKKCGKRLIVPAMIGGSALLADGVLTPAVTVTTAVEGLRSIPAMDRFLGDGQGKVIVITLTIITLLFAVQRVGTSRIGRAFGPIMLLWFSFLGFTGVLHILEMPTVIRAFNPVYAVRILFSDYNKVGFMILGSVFLAATGAEALYSDMGHVGKEHIYRSWPFVKICLILNYLGQGAWIIGSASAAGLSAVILAVFGSIESVFFISSLSKFAHGGYVAVLMALLLFFIMEVWHKGTELEQKYSIRLYLPDYIENLRLLKTDTETPLCANNLVFLDKLGDKDSIDRDILYSILDKDPKRAEAYWFFSLTVTDEPDASRYSVETYGTDFIFHVNLELGFKNDQLLNFYLRQIVGELIASGELPQQQKKFSIYGPSNVGSFKFGILRRSISPGSELTRAEELVLTAKYFIRHMCGSVANWYGLETSSTITEYVPLAIPGRKIRSARLERVESAEAK